MLVILIEFLLNFIFYRVFLLGPFLFVGRPPTCLLKSPANKSFFGNYGPIRRYVPIIVGCCVVSDLKTAVCWPTCKILAQIVGQWESHSLGF